MRCVCGHQRAEHVRGRGGCLDCHCPMFERPWIATHWPAVLVLLGSPVLIAWLAWFALRVLLASGHR